MEHPGRPLDFSHAAFSTPVVHVRIATWKPREGRPDNVGQYRSVYCMRIDPLKLGQVFQICGWGIAFIVSEPIKQALERALSTGMRFTKV